MNQHHLATAQGKQTSAKTSHPEADAAHSSADIPEFVEGCRPASGHSIGPEGLSGAAEAPRKPKQRKVLFKAGDHVSFNAEGVKGAGTVDAVMPDNSALWIWTDGGMGRRMLFPGSGTLVQPTMPAPEPTYHHY